ncbi:protein TIFY 8 isoform X1 [Populus alba x Populus x berolinensis]|uniref:Protein TIFY n=2 Tax=Populus alba x Populus x berolinensis TaxID=444605 RepID=A0AAD6W0Z2_9ROSI|nr:protein TIFY 8 isoform X1 [Populus alba x Populus x berolinensis]
MAVVLTMAQQSKNNNANSSHNNSVYVNNSTATSQQQQKQDLKAMFHDFLGMKGTTDSPVVLAPKNKDGSPSASASLGASSGGGRGPLSSTSDLASERQAGNHLEGIPFYGPRSDISGPEISNRLAGSKRSNSDSAFTVSRDGIPQMAHDSIESLHLMKMLKNGGGRERPRRSNDDEVFYGMQPMRPSSASLILQPSAGSRLDANVSKQDRSIPMGIGAYPPRGGQFVPFTHQVPTNRFRDTNAGPSIVSQSAADEGSRTGIKGPGILSSINAGSGISEKNSSRGLPSGGKPKTGIHISEPESSNPSSRQGLTSASRQMTIFYGGQAHVFDDVHPNKADVIMALAGSNGGSWSTTYSPKPNASPSSESYVTSGGEYELRGRLSVTGNSTQGVGSSDRISTPTGGHHGNIVIAKETRNAVQAGEPSNEEK